MTTFASMFTGGGLADQGARMAGLTPVWGVEFDPAIAAVAQQNDDSGTVYAADVRSVDYAALPRVDVLHASPPCPSFSIAKTDRGETALDLELADAVARAITAQQPALFTLENVRGYANSESLTRIQAALLDLDYHVTTAIVNAADHGVPQTRERLFLLAHAGGWMQPARPLPQAQPWQGWYAAIEDLIPTLPESQFAPWQEKRLKESEINGCFLMRGANSQQEWGEGAPRPFAPAYAVTTDSPPRAFIVSNSKTEYSDGLRFGDEPALATTPQQGGRLRAFMPSSVNGDGTTQPRTDDDPAFTVQATAIRNMPRAWLMSGRVVAMTPRALARFQSVPDTYVLPDHKALACKIIGNGVACQAYAALLRSQL